MYYMLYKFNPNRVCLEFTNICKDLFVGYLLIGKLSVQNLLACSLKLIYLARFSYFRLIRTFNTVIYFAIAIRIYSTEIDNQSTIHCCLQPFVNFWNSYIK